VTLDTNVLRDYWENRPGREHVEELLRRAAAGEIELAVTERIHEDVPCPPLSNRIAELPTLDILKTATAARMDKWELGHHMLGEQAFVDAAQRITDEMAKTMKREKLPDSRDWDHVHAHHLLHRDVFLTRDKKLLHAIALLPEELRVTAMTPEKFLSSCAREENTL
jgi:hypothetical protein